MTKIPRFVIILILAGIFCATFAWKIFQKERANLQPLPVYGTVPDFRLIDQTGQEFSNLQLRGNTWVADFIFTSCTMICPAMTTRMKELQDRLLGTPALKMISFSVDPVRDTPQVLAKYAANHGAVPGHWYFLTGPEEQIHQLVIKGFFLGLQKESEENPILHSGKFVLVDGNGQIRGFFDNDDPQEMKSLVDGIKRLTGR